MSSEHLKRSPDVNFEEAMKAGGILQGSDLEREELSVGDYKKEQG